VLHLAAAHSGLSSCCACTCVTIQQIRACLSSAHSRSYVLTGGKGHWSNQVDIVQAIEQQRCLSSAQGRSYVLNRSTTSGELECLRVVGQNLARFNLRTQPQKSAAARELFRQFVSTPSVAEPHHAGVQERAEPPEVTMLSGRTRRRASRCSNHARRVNSTFSQRSATTVLVLEAHHQQLLPQVSSKARFLNEKGSRRPEVVQILATLCRRL
jgi:hypothetical protein